ncbi:MAG: PilZ domain-containing protein [bacterium]|nr:hypothetical protein [Gammaproteobacteria bacterium]HIL96184.1 hypothetical protein [Pseudomonadales bacterium]
MDKRVEPRIENRRIKFFVHIHECKEEQSMVGVSIACEAIDFSTRGLQFSTATVLPPHTLLNITIGVGEPFIMFLLREEIRWVRDNGDDMQMGVLIQEVPGTDYSKWEAEFTNIFQNDGS